MSGNEYEAFEVTDYDLANEFNPNRPRRKLTKNQQIYGIWADSDSDADSDVELKGRRGGGRGSKVRSTGPVNFVTGGIQQSGSFKKTETTQGDDQITDEDDEGPSHSRAVQGKNTADSATNSSSEEDSTQPSRMGFGMKQRQPASSSKNVGAWEQHTKGIGAKLLLQMGYKPGMGLGKDLQGIAQPVQATLRKGRGAIGAYGPETPQTIGDPGNNKQIDGDETKEYKEKNDKWKKTEGKKDSRKNRYQYRSVEEVIEKGKKQLGGIMPDKLSRKLGNVPVIDMTGPEKRVLSGYNALGQTKIIDEDLFEPSKCKSSGFALPELMHNLNLIVNQCEQEIVSLDMGGREATDRYQALEQEKKNLEKIVKLEEDHIGTLEKALELVEELTNDPDNLSLSRAEKIFIELQKDFAAEYKEFALGDLAAGVIAPLVNNELKNWNPLENPLKFIETVKKWRTILDMHPSGQRNNVFDPYSSLVWAGVIPSFRASVSEWNPKAHQKMAALLDCWAPLFPTWILDNVLEQLILPQLVAGVNDWDPLTDTVPIHSWILPWNSILGHKMEEYIFPTIREKLAFALQAWTPQDRSARAMLTPWKGAFDESEMQAFLLKHIIPKLQMALNELVINPLQQDLELWNQVWEWNELIPPLLMGQMLDKFFFPKWIQVLVLWLNQSPDFDQISRWYTGWKSVFGEELSKQPMIKEHLRRALEMMQRATEVMSTPQPVPTPVAPPHPSIATSSSSLPTLGVGVGASSQPPPALMDLQITPPVQLEFKELVSQKCAERGVIFAPMPGRREFGKQVYRVGKLFCYIDRNVIMLSDGTLKNWTPTSLGLTIERAISG